MLFLLLILLLLLLITKKLFARTFALFPAPEMAEGSAQVCAKSARNPLLIRIYFYSLFVVVVVDSTFLLSLTCRHVVCKCENGRE